jgi:hypothetical protein
MEEWNVGILGVRAEIKHFNCKKLLSFNFVQDKLTHYSITPSFHYSNCEHFVSQHKLSELTCGIPSYF